MISLHDEALFLHDEGAVSYVAVVSLYVEQSRHITK